eukprot:3941994-Rhodomonas_salina.3
MAVLHQRAAAVRIQWLLASREKRGTDKGCGTTVLCYGACCTEAAHGSTVLRKRIVLPGPTRSRCVRGLRHEPRRRYATLSPYARAMKCPVLT